MEPGRPRSGKLAIVVLREQEKGVLQTIYPCCQNIPGSDRKDGCVGPHLQALPVSLLNNAPQERLIQRSIQFEPGGACPTGLGDGKSEVDLVGNGLCPRSRPRFVAHRGEADAGVGRERGSEKVGGEVDVGGIYHAETCVAGEDRQCTGVSAQVTYRRDTLS